MGTRANIGFRFQHQDWLMYHHNSGGLPNLGLEIINFCKEHDVERLRSRVSKFVRIGDHPPTLTATRIKQVAAAQDWPQERTEKLLLQLKDKDKEKRPTWDDMFYDAASLSDFMGDLNYWPDYGTFIWHSNCEWAYIINLDEEALEIYTHHYNAPGHETTYKKVKPGGRYSGYFVGDAGPEAKRGATLLNSIPLKDLREVPSTALQSYANRIDRQH